MKASDVANINIDNCATAFGRIILALPEDVSPQVKSDVAFMLRYLEMSADVFSDLAKIRDQRRGDDAGFPVVLSALARALPNSCDPSHEPRENPAICKACDESRDELQQMVGDGDLTGIAIAVGVYLRRLYVVHDRIAEAAQQLDAAFRLGEPLGLWIELVFGGTAELEEIFAEVLTDEEREIPTDDEARDMVRKALGAETNEEAAEMIRRAIERRKREVNNG